MQKYNPHSNRRNFGQFGNKFPQNKELPQNNPMHSDYFKSYLFPEKETGSEYKNRKNKSYSYMSIKTTPAKTNENTFHEKFLNVILITAVITAVVCMCLSVASMFMFFSL